MVGERKDEYKSLSRYGWAWLELNRIICNLIYFLTPLLVHEKHTSADSESDYMLSYIFFNDLARR